MGDPRTFGQTASGSAGERPPGDRPAAGLPRGGRIILYYVI